MYNCDSQYAKTLSRQEGREYRQNALVGSRHNYGSVAASESCLMHHTTPQFKPQGAQPREKATVQEYEA